MSILRLGLVASLLLVAPHAGAQRPYETITISGAGLRNLEYGLLADGWTARDGWQVGIDTPFELGTLSAIVGRVGYDGSPGRPAYTATLLLGGVGTRPQRLGPLRASVGVRFGSYRMRFDDPDIDPGLRNENEMIVLGAARLDLSLGGGLSLFGDASTGALLLSTRTRMTFAAAGAAYTMRTPRWLGTLLK